MHSVVFVNRRPATVAGQLGGELGNTTRRVEVQLTGSFPDGLEFSAHPGAALIRMRLTERNWWVPQVTLQSSGWLPGWSDQTYRVYVDVFPQFSDADIVNGMRQDLAGLFETSSVAIVSSAQNPGGTSPQGSQPSQPSPGSQPSGSPVIYVNPTTNPPSDKKDSSSSSWSSFFDQLALGFGVSAPVAIAGTALVLLIALRK